MESQEVLVEALGRIRGLLRMALDGLSADQLAYRPAEEANSIAWLAWHLTRVQDHHLSDLAGREQAWIADGWHARFGRPATSNGTGFGNSAEQVAEIRPDGPEVLRDYYAAVHARSLEFVQHVSAAELDRVLDEPWWNPRPTVGVRLVSVIEDCLQHVGQMAYIRGLIEGRHWLGY